MLCTVGLLCQHAELVVYDARHRSATSCRLTTFFVGAAAAGTTTRGCRTRAQCGTTRRPTDRPQVNGAYTRNTPRQNRVRTITHPSERTHRNCRHALTYAARLPPLARPSVRPSVCLPQLKNDHFQGRMEWRGAGGGGGGGTARVSGGRPARLPLKLTRCRRSTQLRARPARPPGGNERCFLSPADRPTNKLRSHATPSHLASYPRRHRPTSPGPRRSAGPNSGHLSPEHLPP